MKDGKEIFRGTQKEVEAIADKLKGMSDDVAKKYLDELIETKKLDDFINTKDYKFRKLGLRFQHSFKNFKTGMKEINHYIIDSNGKKYYKELHQSIKKAYYLMFLMFHLIIKVRTFQKRCMS